MDTWSRDEEKKFTTRADVLALLDKNVSAYNVWLDSLTDEQLNASVSMGPQSFPMTSAITFAADHTRAHASQIDYMQTIYGDLDWHMG